MSTLYPLPDVSLNSVRLHGSNLVGLDPEIEIRCCSHDPAPS